MHISVLKEAVVNNTPKQTQCFVDATLGRGGHFFALLKKFNIALAFDGDSESIKFVYTKLKDLNFKEESNKENIIKLTFGKKKVFLVNDNFAKLTYYLNKLNIHPNLILADLGLSTNQIKQSKKGFSFTDPNEPLDMRISSKTNLTAADLLNMLSQKELTALLKNLGEVSKASQYAAKIVNYRKIKKMQTVGDLIKCLNLYKKPGQKRHPATKPFMALRIAVNSEHINLKSFLNQAKLKINKGCLLQVITFHSLEEKSVKKFINKNNYSFKIVSPSLKEVATNKSSRSAKLFIIKNEKN